MSNEFHHDSIEPELEIRLTALLLGEASDFERSQLQQLLNERPELAQLYNQLQRVHGALSEIGVGEPVDEDQDWKLASDRRAELLTVLSGGKESTRPSFTAVEEQVIEKRKGFFTSKYVIAIASAACVMLCAGWFLSLRAMKLPEVDEWLASVDISSRVESLGEVTTTEQLSAGTVVDFAIDPDDPASMDSIYPQRGMVQRNKSPQDALSAIRGTLDQSSLPSAHYLQDDVQYFQSPQNNQMAQNSDTAGSAVGQELFVQPPNVALSDGIINENSANSAAGMKDDYGRAIAGEGGMGGYGGESSAYARSGYGAMESAGGVVVGGGGMGGAGGGMAGGGGMGSGMGMGGYGGGYGGGGYGGEGMSGYGGTGGGYGGTGGGYGGTGGGYGGTGGGYGGTGGGYGGTGGGYGGTGGGYGGMGGGYGEEAEEAEEAEGLGAVQQGEETHWNAYPTIPTPPTPPTDSQDLVEPNYKLSQNAESKAPALSDLAMNDKSTAEADPYRNLERFGTSGVPAFGGFDAAAQPTPSPSLQTPRILLGEGEARLDAALAEQAGSEEELPPDASTQVAGAPAIRMQERKDELTRAPVDRLHESEVMLSEQDEPFFDSGQVRGKGIQDSVGKPGSNVAGRGRALAIDGWEQANDKALGLQKQSNPASQPSSMSVSNNAQVRQGGAAPSGAPSEVQPPNQRGQNWGVPLEGFSAGRQASPQQQQQQNSDAKEGRFESFESLRLLGMSPMSGTDHGLQPADEDVDGASGSLDSGGWRYRAERSLEELSQAVEFGDTANALSFKNREAQLPELQKQLQRQPSAGQSANNEYDADSYRAAITQFDVLDGEQGQLALARGGTSRSGLETELLRRRGAGRGFEQKSIASEGLKETSAEVEAFSTFSLHVSDVSFKLALAALSQGEWPDASKIRLEEFVNAFDYRDPLPSRDERVACRVEQAIHPILMQRNVLRIAMRTAATGRAGNTPLRLTLLLDNSGSMERPDRRQTVRRAFQTLTQQLKPGDQVTLISFASTPRLLADQVSGSNAAELVPLIENLPSEGGTNIEAALNLAMEKAVEQQLAGAQNRIVLLTDGAVNLGDADPTSLSQLVTEMRDSGLAFDAAGISAQDLNDDVLEALTRQGDGRYYLLDSVESASAGFAEQIAGALRPSAKNVKVQIEFNPQRVGQYKLLGFEKHRLKKEDFRNDQIDAAEMAAAEAGVAVYQFEAKPDGQGDVGSVSVRFQDMSTGRMVENRWPIPYETSPPHIDQAAPALRIATAAALLAAKLRGGPLGESTDLKTLATLTSGLPESFRNTQRIQQLQTMIELARQINGSR